MPLGVAVNLMPDDEEMLTNVFVPFGSAFCDHGGHRFYCVFLFLVRLDHYNKAVLVVEVDFNGVVWVAHVFVFVCLCVLDGD